MSCNCSCAADNITRTTYTYSIFVCVWRILSHDDVDKLIAKISICTGDGIPDYACTNINVWWVYVNYTAYSGLTTEHTIWW